MFIYDTSSLFTVFLSKKNYQWCVQSIKKKWQHIRFMYCQENDNFVVKYGALSAYLSEKNCLKAVAADVMEGIASDLRTM